MDTKTALHLLQNYKDEYKSSLDFRQSPKGKIVKEAILFLQAASESAFEQAKSSYPFLVFQASYEQALILNAWIFGYTFPLVFTANRIGKTTASIINNLLYSLPTPPDAPIFAQQTDHLNRTYRVYPRPSIATISQISRFVNIPNLLPTHNPYLPPDHPENKPFVTALRTLHAQNGFPDPLESCFPSASFQPAASQFILIWHGAPDHSLHREIIIPEWRKWLPPSSIVKDSEVTHELHFKSPKQPRFPKGFNIKINFKSFESKDEKWASGATDHILLTEGVPGPIFEEIRARFRFPATGFWDYTPCEPTNTRARSHFAEKIFKKEEPVPLQPVVFTKFRLIDAPDRIVPKEKKDDMIRNYKDKPEGAARLNGEFFSSTPLILSNLPAPTKTLLPPSPTRAPHYLPLTKEELFELYPNAILYRGLDPGLDHPTACVWIALLPTNQLVVYRYLSIRNITIQERVRLIVKMSGNVISERPLLSSASASTSTSPNRYRSISTEENDGDLQAMQNPDDQSALFSLSVRFEAHPNPFPQSEPIQQTIVDFHTFKRDETTLLPYAQNYIREGLYLTESTHYPPAFRFQKVNSMLEPSHAFADPITRRPPAPQLFFLPSEEGVLPALQKFQTIYWDTYSQGNRKGQPKDRPQDFDDDELDALSYVCTYPMVWTRRPRRVRLPFKLPKEGQIVTKPEGYFT